MKKILAIIGLLLMIGFPGEGVAATFKYGAWMPFWNKSDGMFEAAISLDKLSEVSPFSYEVNPNGTLLDRLKMSSDTAWITWLSAARDLKVKIIPTIAWFDGDGLHALLSSKAKRTAHIKNIVSLAVTQKFDGIDIDYENKKAETKPYFSAFIKELAAALHAKKKTLACTIEPRTPAADRFKVIPQNLEFANDYVVLGKYCDQVRVMAYDQGRIDLNLNAAKSQLEEYYAPVADPVWVEKVLKETLKQIPAGKIMLGIPTYGYEWRITQDSSGTPQYTRRRSVTYKTVSNLLGSLGAVPQRNSAGELWFTYSTTTMVGDTPTSSFRFVDFTDATAVAQKIALAKKYKLRGAVLFKVDGMNDSAVWQQLK